MAWAGFMDSLEEKIYSDNFKKLRIEYPKWPKYKNVEDFREDKSEYQIIEAGKKLKLYGKGDTQNLHGLLSRRNKCAHPSNYDPKINQSLGYISELIDCIIKLQSVSL